MAAVASTHVEPARDFPRDRSLDRAIDRWIYVFMAAWFIAIVLNGFIPSSLDKIAAVQAGERPPFPLIMHAHAVLMGSFLLLLLAQTWLAAVGRCDLHRRLGVAGMVIAPALVVAGLMLVPTIYHSVWNAAHSAPAPLAGEMHERVQNRDNILLIQLRIGLLFSLFLLIGLRARKGNPGLHKRMMILATAMTLSAGFARIPWLPGTLPDRPTSGDLYTLLAIAPMFLWDVMRHGTIHRAWLIWFGINIPAAILVHGLWDREWWHMVVPRIMGV